MTGHGLVVGQCGSERSYQGRCDTVHGQQVGTMRYEDGGVGVVGDLVLGAAYNIPPRAEFVGLGETATAGSRIGPLHNG